jgi:large subunit ribosomal protein L24
LQTTLLGLAIALILALVAALVGPLLIDWGSYRSTFETEASRVIGLEVQVTGPIDARLLPSPQLTLHDIEIGANGAEKTRVRSLSVEFALGPLMRGEWRASQLHVVGPQLRLGLDSAGRLQTPNMAVHFNPDALAIERLDILDGTVSLADAASGASLTLDKIRFTGEARSLLGPYSGEGAATVAGAVYPFRIAVGRYSDGNLRLRINVDPTKHPLSVEAQGTLAFGDGKPAFDGSISLSRPVAIASRSAGTLSPPWRISGKVKATAASALLRDLEFDYGSLERGFKLTGVADFAFGKQPHLSGVLSGRQIDVDRALGGGDFASPYAAIGTLAQLASGAFQPSFPIQIGIGLDQLTLGGDTVQDLRGDISASAKGWNLDRFEFRAPGVTDVRLSGRLSIADDHAAFNGPVAIKTSNAIALATWLEGQTAAAKSEPKPLSLQGQLTLAADRIAINGLTAEFDRKTINGHFAYTFASGDRPAQLDAAFQAPELDLDAALAFGNDLLAGSPVNRPHDIILAADIGHATIAGLAAKNASARLKVSSNGLQIDQLSVADLGGAAFSANGRIVTAAPAPQGSVRFDLDAPDPTPITRLLSRYAPQSAEVLDRNAANLAPAKLRGTLTVESTKTAVDAKISIDGRLGQARLAFDSGIKADPISFELGDVTVRGKLAADDGKALVAMLGLDRVVAVVAGPGEWVLSADGPLRGDWRINSKLTAGGLDVTADGTANLLADEITADLHTAIAHADAAPLRRENGGPLPISLSGRVTVAGQDVSLSDLDATIDGAAVHGKLKLSRSSPRRLEGEIDADHVNGVGLIAAAIGLPSSPEDKGAAWRWSSEPFGAGGFGNYVGTIKLKARQIELLPQLTAREFDAKLNLSNNEFSLDDLAANIARGRLSGRLSFRSGDDGLKAYAKLALASADAAALSPAASQPLPFAGTIAVSAELEGAGRSAVALIGSLHGSGKFTLRDAYVDGLNPRVFDAVAHAVDQGLPIEAARVSEVVSKALQGGQLSIKYADGEIAVSTGQLHLNEFSTDSDGARLSLAGNLDLTDGSVNARLVLSGLGERAGTRPEIFMALSGPIAAPQRSTDVSALVSWLTLRAVDNQTRRLREIENASPSLPKRYSAPTSLPAVPITNPAPTQQKRETAAAVRNEVALPPKRPPIPKMTRTSKGNRAPDLPAPVEVLSLPKPVGKPATSAVGPQN